METPKYRTITEEIQWRAYNDQKAAHDTAREKVRPKREDFMNDADYNAAHQKWVWESSVDAPNKPGYEFANND